MTKTTGKPATREAWLTEFARLARPQFKAAGRPLPKEIRCSVGFPSTGKRSLTIGECWYHENSADGHAEIFIRPSLQSNSSRVADILTHELCHAALGSGFGHGKEFKHLATSLGLTGKMTATTAGPGWHAWADPILKQLGKLPGANLGKGEELVGGKKKQTTRMLKLVCTSCDWTCRTTAAHIFDNMDCPAHERCGGHIFQPD